MTSNIKQCGHKGILAGFALSTSILTSTLTIAEESGAFLGAEVGYGNVFDIQESQGLYGFYGSNKTYTVNDSPSGTDNGLHSPVYGFIVGYKQFFNDYVGLRYYGNATWLDTLDIYVNMRVSIINYAANVDCLFNFIAKESIDFGGFVGVGLGGNYASAGLDEEDANSFSVALNTGLRTNIAKHHGIEIVARLPFLNATTGRKKTNPDGVQYGFFLHNPYNITVRYVYSF